MAIVVFDDGCCCTNVFDRCFRALHTHKHGVFLGIPATGIWTILLLIYAFIASNLPVQTLLQPRDYINAWQLYIALALILCGIFITGFSGDLQLISPTVQWNPTGAPSMWPFLFITIACGAISGFHALVSSGTSSKQLSSETDALFVGYGSMLLEAFLATCVIIAVTAGLCLSYTQTDGQVLVGLEAWNAHYFSWTASAGLGSKLHAVVEGFANILASLGIEKSLGTVIIGVFIASFAGTTLDTSVRLQRYALTELLSQTTWSRFATPFASTSLAVITAAFLAFSSGADGKGALLLWPLFGAVNQLLAAFALLLATYYLKKQKANWFFTLTLLPSCFVLGVSLWAGVHNQWQFFEQSQWLLFFLNGSILCLSLPIVISCCRLCKEIIVNFIQSMRKKSRTSRRSSVPS